jgi:hypothetical protein
MLWGLSILLFRYDMDRLQQSVKNQQLRAHLFRASAQAPIFRLHLGNLVPQAPVFGGERFGGTLE